MPGLDKRQQQALDALLSAKKLRELCPDTIRRVFLECLPKYKSLKDVDKAARTELHRITGAFVTPENLTLAERLLDGWQRGDDETLAHALALHASTKERLPLADTDALYDRICDCIGRPETVLDLACGFNPIYLASRGYDVMGLDLHGGAVRLINRWAQQKSLPARAQTADLLSENALPEEAFDLALMMKLLPILDTQQSGAAADRFRERAPHRRQLPDEDAGRPQRGHGDALQPVVRGIDPRAADPGALHLRQ